MGSMTQWCLLVIGLQAALGVEPPAPHAAGVEWASRTAQEWRAAGLPDRITSRAASATMLDAATKAIWNHAHLIDRDTRFVELFSGKSGTTSAYITNFNAAAIPYDKNRGINEDLTTATGLLYAMFLLACVCVGGAIHMSPQCSSRLMMCMGHAKRSRESPDGDTQRDDVLHANHAAEFVLDGGDERPSGHRR
eukprot:2950876-Pyramimonas_sp.AAC.1